MIWNKTKKRNSPGECIYSTFIRLCTAQQPDGVGGTGERQWGRTHPDVSIWWADPWTPGGALHWVRPGGAGGVDMTDWRQEQSYIQVRLTFHQSRTIHSILCRSPRLSVCLDAGGTHADEAAGEAAAGHWLWPPLPQKRTVSLFCLLTPVVEHRQCVFLKKSWKCEICKILFLFIF